MHTRNRIISKASEFYGSLGINAVRNDDIASSLGISKATIYKHFESKECLVNRVVESQLARHFDQLSRIRSQATTAIQVVDQVSDYMMQIKNETNMNFYRDVKRSYDSASRMISDFMCDLQELIIQPAVKTGVRDGYFRSDTREVFVSEMWLALIEWQPAKPGDWVYAKRHFIRGLLTDKGRSLYHPVNRPEEWASVMIDKKNGQEYAHDECDSRYYD